MPIDRIKLDMQFVRGIGRSEKENAIIRGIISLTHTLGLKVIAEGVESELQLDFLTKSSIDEIQGFYYYKPMPPDEVEQSLLRESSGVTHSDLGRTKTVCALNADTRSNLVDDTAQYMSFEAEGADVLDKALEPVDTE